MTLDNEPTAPDADQAPDSQTLPVQAEPAAPRTRRRAATRPAGSPETAPAAGAQEPAAQAAAAQPAAAEPAGAPARKRASRKKVAPTPVSTVIEPEQVDPADPAGVPTAEQPAGEPAVEAAPAAPRRRTRKAAAAPVAVAAAQPEPTAEPAPSQAQALDEDAVTEPVSDQAAEPARSPFALPLFQAPDPSAAAPRRRRAASRPAGPPVPVEHLEAGTPEDGAAPAASAAEPAEAPPARTRSRRSRGQSRAEGAADELAAEPAAPVTDALDADPAGSTADAGDDEGDDGTDEAGDDESARRRRRRRGGRGRRGRTRLDGEADPDGEAGPDGEEGDDEAVGEAETETEDAQDDASEDGGAAGTRRRRRRRRRGAGGGESEPGPDDPPNTVVRVRESRRSSGGGGGSSDDVSGLRGSTRLEAKKQRRREGREAGRRRPIITEAEFLARREAVERVMIVREREGRTQIGVLEDGVLVEHYVARRTQTSMVGNVYLGKVQNVLPSMEAAFVDIGKGRNAVLYAGEVNWDAAGMEGQPKRIEHALKSGESVLVQVTKDPIGHKGARLTSQISLPGRYLVYVPDGSMTGISRKLPDLERTRLKKVLRDVVPEDAGVIVRTAAEGASEAELERDVSRLKAQWEDIARKSGAVNSPALLYGEPDLAIRVVRDIFNEDFASLIVSGDDAWDTLQAYIGHVAPDLVDRITRWEGEGDVFAAHRIDEQLAKALDRKVWLPSGGSLVIDRTEAMTVVDVNTGKFTGAGGNLEETVTKNNVEAAEEIVRQLRLRDIGGIIVVDFIDMVLESNRELVLRRLLECLGRDRTKHQVAEVTSLGLVQMTRKRVGSGLLEVFSETCEHCGGRGLILHDEPVEKRQQGEQQQRQARGGSGQGGGASSQGGSGAGGGSHGGGGSNGGGSNGGGSNGGAAQAASGGQPAGSGTSRSGRRRRATSGAGPVPSTGGSAGSSGGAEQLPTGT